MAEATHLQPVPPFPATGDDDSGGDGVQRSASRSRPTRAVLTDRLRPEVTQSIMRTVARLSGSQRRAVAVSELGAAMKLHPDSARLPLPFFKECLILEKSGRGDYMSTEALNTFLMNESFGMGHSASVKPLREVMLDSWYWQTVSPLFEFGPAPMATVRAAIMRTAGASPHHLAMVDNTIRWLEWVELIRIDGDTVERFDSDAPAESTGRDDADDPVDDVPDVIVPTVAEMTTPEAITAVQESTTEPQEARHEPPVRLTLHVNLTDEHIASLNGTQLGELFEAIQKIATLSS